MRITLVDVINKYDTNIDTECLIETFKNMILFSDVQGDHFLGLTDEKITLKEIPEPKILVKLMEIFMKNIYSLLKDISGK